MPDAPFPQYVRRERIGRLSFSTKLYQGIGAIPDTCKNWAFNTRYRITRARHAEIRAALDSRRLEWENSQ
jgi:hypothetical protein